MLEGYLLAQERVDSYFIRRIQHSGTSLAVTQRLEGKRKQGEGIKIGCFKRQLCGPNEIKRGRCSLYPIGVVQRVGNTKAHIGHGKLCNYRAINIFHHRVYYTFGVDHYLYFVGGNVKKPCRLNDLKALVHKGCAVDGYLLSH